MKITEEKGVTLLVLVTTIIILLILTSIGVTSGISTLNSAKFSQFKEELKILQTKVNELNQNDEINLGEELTETQKNILNITDISKIIYNDKTEEEKKEIQNGFRYFNNESLKNELDLEGIKRDYLINFKYRYIVCYKGVEYNGTTYYMSEQIENTYYNVQYKDKNEKNGRFEVNTTKEDGRYKIQISNIQHNGYVDNWQVKYKLEEDNYWTTSNNLCFYVKKEGNYIIEVVHGDEISLGTKNERVMFDGTILDKVQNNVIEIGDYIKYIPDTVSTDDILTELNIYSGNTNDTKNTKDTLEQENLNWRVLDVENGRVRLICELPTTSTVALEGYNGYNNAVYLLDKTCNILYNKSGYVEKVQNLKLEDVEKYIKTKPTIEYKTYYPTNKYYPNILKEEKNQTIQLDDGTTQPSNRIDLSEQENPINQTTANETTELIIKNTMWNKKITETDFTNPIYYNLLINNGNNYRTYWMSSRCVNADDTNAYFHVRVMYNGTVNDCILYHSWNHGDNNAWALRPIVTLKSDVEIDTTDASKDGKNSTNAWILK